MAEFALYKLEVRYSTYMSIQIRKFVAKALSLSFYLVVGSAAFSHHAMEVHYTTSQEAVVLKEGLIKNFSALDPHSYLVVTVDGEGGSQDWVLEGQSRVILARTGWRFELLKSGAPVRFYAYPARSGDFAGRLLYLEVEDEKYCSDRCDLFDSQRGITNATPSSSVVD